MTKTCVYTEADLLDYDPFEGGERDLDIRCRTTAIVTTRKAHGCALGGQHEIAPGSRARYEAALVDGAWGRYYVCVTCMTRWLRERGIRPGSE